MTNQQSKKKLKQNKELTKITYFTESTNFQLEATIN